MGLQSLGINPGLANPKRPRPAVGDQVQGADGITSLTLLLQAVADPLQRMPFWRSFQHRKLCTVDQGLNLRTVVVCDQQLFCRWAEIER